MTPQPRGLFRKIGFRYKLMMPVILFIVAITSFTLWNSFRLESRRVWDDYYSQADFAARVLTNLLSHRPWPTPPGVLQTDLMDLNQSNPAFIKAHIYIRTPNGYQIEASSKPQDIGKMGDAEDWSAIKQRHMVVNSRSKGFAELNLPIWRGDLPVASLGLYLSTARPDSALRQDATRTLIFGSGAIVGLVILLYLILDLLILRWLKDLNQAADSVGRMDLTARIDFPKHAGMRDELAKLTETFNFMAASLERNHNELAELAWTDPLTGLANHRSFQEQLEAALKDASRHNDDLSLVLLDLDDFKKINDTLGHLAGDTVLREVGAILRETIPESAFAARYGGDELAVVLPLLGPKESQRVAQGIQERISGHIFHLDDHSSSLITTSIGLASFPWDAEDRIGLIQTADHALYFAKAQGGNRIGKPDTFLQNYQNDPSELSTILDNANRATVEALAGAVDARERSYLGHSQRVATYALAIAEELPGLPMERREPLRIAGLLHDIGKIGIPEDVLAKRGTLTPEEFELIKKHPQVGAELLRTVPFLREELPIIRSHHEAWDGSGYPDGLSRDLIPLEARILAVADTLDALLSRRPYRENVNLNVALEKIRSLSGLHFDPRVVDALERAVEAGRIPFEKRRASRQRRRA